ncbi:MAG: NADPH-dependent assimilatory sulfite reductase hemoprotein subunit [Acidimicrobiales bacterium]
MAITDLQSESSVEAIKRASDRLRGNLADELASDAADVSAESEQILKFHGIYSQDNRDVRRERAMAGESLEYIFMIRVVIPGGRLTPEQWLGLDAIASTLSDGTIRLTTRQAVQFHGVLKGSLQQLATALDQQYLSSFGACGDVVRNVVTCPQLHLDGENSALENIAYDLRQSFRSTSEAHWEIFVNGERAVSREESDERTFYGDTYLPRKFKIAVAHPDENCVDVFAQDVGLIPIEHEELGAGFVVLVGGGLGRSYAKEDTFARLAEPLAFVTRDEVQEVIAAIVATYRDLGNRQDRQRARMKYVVADLGLDAFRSEVEERLGRALSPAMSLPAYLGADDHLGWREATDGTWQLGIRVGAGRVRDTEHGSTLRSALREIAARGSETFLITPQQDILIANIAPSARGAIEAIVAAHGVREVRELGNVERSALACPALPTCSQALTEAERRLPELVSGLEDALRSRSLQRRPLQLRMTGCPNGCARPALAEVGIVGRTKSTYDVYVGGGPSGTRLASIHREKVKLEDIPEVLSPLLDRWASEGESDEAFGDFLVRVGLR